MQKNYNHGTLSAFTFLGLESILMAYPPLPNRKLPEEQQIVKAAANGDEQAFASLYDTYLDSIYRFIYLRVEDQQTAEDITSNVFLKAWEKLDKYQFRGVPFRAWLFRIARNAVIDHYRTRKEMAPLEAVIALKTRASCPFPNGWV